MNSNDDNNKIDNLTNMLTNGLSELSTKIDSFRSKLSAEIGDVRSKLSAGLDSVHSELSTDINSLRQEVYSLKTEMRDGFEKVDKRIDNIGLQLANLEDDTPTRDEFDSLESKVKRLVA